MADKNINVKYLLNRDTYLFFLKALLSCPSYAYHRNNDLTMVLSPDIFLTRQKESVEVVMPLVCFNGDWVSSRMRNPLTHDVKIYRCSHWTLCRLQPLHTVTGVPNG